MEMETVEGYNKIGRYDCIPHGEILSTREFSPWGARLSIAGSSLFFGFVLLVTEVVVDD